MSIQSSQPPLKYVATLVSTSQLIDGLQTLLCKEDWFALTTADLPITSCWFDTMFHLTAQLSSFDTAPLTSLLWFVSNTCRYVEQFTQQNIDISDFTDILEVIR